MAAYRCYQLDAKDKVIGVELFEADSHEEACERCDRVMKEKAWAGAELWELRYKIKCAGSPSG
jgi:hypothetical protein